MMVRHTHIQQRIHEVIFEADTFWGKVFDIFLILSIILSVVVVMLDSITDFHEAHSTLLYRAEWFFTLLFTIEYLLRIYCIRKPWNYVRSFMGLVDLLAILPTYVSLFIPGTQYLIVIRILRVMRIFRVLKLAFYLGEASTLTRALIASRRKITVFLLAVVSLVVIFGAIMYLVEGTENGFTSIPRSIYWAVVTLTTVGYGDISPKTNLGQALASLIMILGYGIIAVPTGIVTTEMALSSRKAVTTQACPECLREGHDHDAVFCKYCSARLNPQD